MTPPIFEQDAGDQIAGQRKENLYADSADGQISVMKEHHKKDGDATNSVERPYMSHLAAFS